MKKNIILTDANSSGVSTTPDMLDITLNNVTTSGNYIFSHNGTSFLPNYSTLELARNIYDKYVDVDEVFEFINEPLSKSDNTIHRAITWLKNGK